jgi:uncharacterized membrane protein
MTDRLDEAERRLRAGDIDAALQLLQSARRAAGTQRDATRMREIVELAQRIEGEAVGSVKKQASLFLVAARTDLLFAEKQDALVRDRIVAGRAAVAAGDAGACSFALEDALGRELGKIPTRRDRAALVEIVALANAISPRARGRALRRLTRVLVEAEKALAHLQVATPSAPPLARTPTARAPAPDALAADAVLTARLDAFEQHIRSLESALAELRERELPALRALVAGGGPAAAPAPVVSVSTDDVQPPVGAWAPAPDVQVWLEIPAPKPAEPVRPPASPKPAGAAPRRPRPAVPQVRLAQLQEPRALAWAGGIVTLLGIVFISILAADRGWVSAELRVVLGALVSAAIYGVGVFAYGRYGRTWAALAAAGAGIGGAYATLAAAGAVYDFIGKPEALLGAAFVAAVGVVTAVRWNTQMTAVLGLVGAMLGPTLIEGGVSVTGSAFVTILLGATVALTVWKRWLETMAIGGLVSFALALSLLGKLSPGDDTAAAVVAATYALLFLAAGIGHDLRPPRPLLGEEIVPAAVAAFLGAGALVPLVVALQVDPGSPVGVPVTLAAVWLAELATAIAYQVVRGAANLQRVVSTLLFAASTLSFATTLRFFEGREEGYALLATAVVYLACLALLRGRGQRDLSSALWAVALTATAVGVADLVSGNELALVWAAEGALLSWLGLRAREPRLLLGALGYLGLALGQTLILAAPPTELIVANDDPAEGVAAVLATAAGLIVFAACYWRAGLDRLNVRGTVVPLPSAWVGSLCAVAAAFALTLYAASLALLGLFTWLGDDFQAAFERGHPAVTSLWGVVALALVVVGLRRRSTALHATGLAVYGVAVAELVLVDLPTLSSTNTAFAALALGVLVLAAGFEQGRLSRATVEGLEVDPLALAFIGSSLMFLVPAIVVLLEGTTWSVDRLGAGLLAAAAVYGALAALVFREKRDFSTVLWAPAFALGAAAVPELLGDPWRALAWSAAGVALAWLAGRAGEPRFLPASGAFVGLALAYALLLEAPPTDLFLAELRPAGGLPSLLLATAAAYAFAASLDGVQRATAFWTAGAVTVFAASVAIVALFQWLAPDDPKSVDDAFQRGQTGVSALWAVVGLVLLSIGLWKDSRNVRIGGLVLFGIALAKLFLYDLSALSAMARALSFLGVGLVLLLAAFLYQRVSGQDDEAESPPRASIT